MDLGTRSSATRNENPVAAEWIDDVVLAVALGRDPKTIAAWIDDGDTTSAERIVATTGARAVAEWGPRTRRWIDEIPTVEESPVPRDGRKSPQIARRHRARSNVEHDAAERATRSGRARSGRAVVEKQP